MVRKIVSVFCASIILSTSLMAGCSKAPADSSASGSKTYKIGITQIVEHPALDDSRKGIIDALKEEGFVEGENLEIDFQNAQGDMPTAQTIAEGFVSAKKDMIVALSTPSSQAAVNATKEITIVFTAVTDPVGAGLVASLEKPGGNVAGISAAAPTEKQFELLKTLVPNAKKVGILYNTSEANSIFQVNTAKAISSKFGIGIVEIGITSSNDIDQSLSSVMGKIDVLYTPTDNIVSSSMPMVVNKCIENKLPLIAAEEAAVKAGALATDGINYYNLGLQTGKIAARILRGEAPQDIPVGAPENTELVINEETAKSIGITIPESLRKK
ncbi:ABC-type uncharacterized transport system, periplasmic component (plasmid) [Peptoclostridium acidaminophilum DSM 3953]|uniref:ABC-type uncharacterized transport system, periplasmic component n=1 Tax=Peptoclostridium acidaminophilum DSM 3953 TaxID=1286171 RepID=W8TP61_PEPAC|nr:ABC transporter substrate-binding protein [Peptoclostridium acidaminophilum]AHM57942.1 ABC-type uncharacterized transport system, periplasmic component [Peptoclostridium acidaminophilum DSM 3953]